MGERNLEIDEDRLRRYREKFEKLEVLIGDLNDWHSGTESLLQDRAMKKAVYKSSQEAGEVVADICAMYLSDSDRVVAHDSENIEKASGELYSDELGSRLIDLNGLRNRVVHDYNGFDDRTALDSILEHIQTLEDLQERLKKWVENS